MRACNIEISPELLLELIGLGDREIKLFQAQMVNHGSYHSLKLYLEGEDKELPEIKPTCWTQWPDMKLQITKTYESTKVEIIKASKPAPAGQ